MASLLSKLDRANLNSAVHSELFASNLYKHLSNQLQRLGYFGAQKHFASESTDEQAHYQLIADFMNDRGDTADIPALQAMADKVLSLRDAIETAYDTELQLGQDYERWYKDSDSVTTQQFLLQFIEIQRKSVGEYGDLLARLDRAGTDECGILLIDQEMGA